MKDLKKVVADDVGTPTSDRRGMIKLVMATAVGAVAGAGDLLGAEYHAAASDGVDPVVQGVTTSPPMHWADRHRVFGLDS